MTDDVNPCSNAVLRQAMRRVGQLYDDVLAPSGLRATQHGLLATVRRMGSPTMRELAERAVMDLSGLSHTLKPLMRDGYLQMAPDARDRRARRIDLTEKGQAKLAETAKLWRGAQDRFEAVFGLERAIALKSELRFLTSPEFQDAFNRAMAEADTRP